MGIGNLHFLKPGDWPADEEPEAEAPFVSEFRSVPIDTVPTQDPGDVTFSINVEDGFYVEDPEGTLYFMELEDASSYSTPDKVKVSDSTVGLSGILALVISNDGSSLPVEVADAGGYILNIGFYTQEEAQTAVTNAATMGMVLELISNFGAFFDDAVPEQFEEPA